MAVVGAFLRTWEPRDQRTHLRRGNAHTQESLCGEVGLPGGVSCPMSQVGRFQSR